jgi:hypothetical protein
MDIVLTGDRCNYQESPDTHTSTLILLTCRAACRSTTDNPEIHKSKPHFRFNGSAKTLFPPAGCLRAVGIGGFAAL